MSFLVEIAIACENFIASNFIFGVMSFCCDGNHSIFPIADEMRVVVHVGERFVGCVKPKVETVAETSARVVFEFGWDLKGKI